MSMIPMADLFRTQFHLKLILQFQAGRFIFLGPGPFKRILSLLSFEDPGPKPFFGSKRGARKHSLDFPAGCPFLFSKDFSRSAQSWLRTVLGFSLGLAFALFVFVIRFSFSSYFVTAFLSEWRAAFDFLSDNFFLHLSSRGNHTAPLRAIPSSDWFASCYPIDFLQHK